MEERINERANERADKRAKRGSVLAKITVFLIIMSILIVGAGAAIWYNIAMSPVDKNNNNQIEIVIPFGTGTNGIAKILKENNVIQNELIFKLYVKKENITDLQAGTYYIKQSMKLQDITEMLRTGKMYDPNQKDITYIEGKNIVWLANLIAENTNNTEEDVYSLLEDEKYIDGLIEKYWFLTEEIKNKDIYYPLEGYLFPDTYTIPNEDVTVEEIFEIMLDQMGKVLSEYQDEIESSPYSVHELLSFASIVEMEGVNTEGRKGVAGVIYNRLDKNMAIQSDVTTYYAFKIDVAERDLFQREIDTYNPYNTRGPNMAGKLPVGPISSVSKVSIEATLDPDETDALFFVSDKNGKLYFTKTNAEHDRVIQELKSQGLWLEY